MIKTEAEYEQALLREKELWAEKKQLKVDILEYQNKFKIPDLYDLGDLKDFIAYESQDGSLVNFEGVRYKVYDYEDVQREYGCESVSDALYEATLKDLTDVSLTMLEKIE